MATVQTPGSYLTCAGEAATGLAYAGGIKDAVEEEADGEGALICLRRTGTAHAVARDGSTPARFMFLLSLVVRLQETQRFLKSSQ